MTITLKIYQDAAYLTIGIREGRLHGYPNFVTDLAYEYDHIDPHHCSIKRVRFDDGSFEWKVVFVYKAQPVIIWASDIKFVRF